MARLFVVVVGVLLLGCVASTLALRTSITLDVHREAAPKTTWRNCHTTMMAKLQTFPQLDALSLPKGLQPFAMSTQGKHAAHSIRESQEGMACSWQEILPGISLCVTNWNQLNKTLTPSNEVARATANLNAKGYVCGMQGDESSCTGVDHCTWNAQFRMCTLSSFYFTLVFACHDSPVRDVSICIDHSPEVCAADPRCKWLAPAAEVCLPNSVPTTWSAAEIQEWVSQLFDDESKFLENWGDCPTSHAWLKLMECGEHPSADSCGKDKLCKWNAPVSVCSLNPEKVVDVLWGGDADTVATIRKRAAYCRTMHTDGMCLRAMPNYATVLS